MALRDLEAFLRQRATIFDPNLDTNPGSPYDTTVIQPLVRRVGPDPFSVDMQTFLTSRLQQAYPDLAIGDGDALTDLVVKVTSLLWDPIVREVTRVRRGLSFQDPSTLTTEEADALGANLFADRAQGSFARGTARIFFAQAQNASVSPVNFVTAKSGLRFFPIESQAIRIEEMLQNIDTNGLYYFDITVIAEAAGSEYNLGPKELVSIANLDAAVQVANQRKFQDGDDAATAADFVDQTQQDLTERSLVTIRGIAAKLPRAFPEITRLNVVGFNDPEMQRDLIQGGSLGKVLIAGSAGATVSDLKGGPFTSRFSTTETDFTLFVGPANTAPVSFVLSVFGAFGAAAVVKDLTVTRVVSANVLEVATREMGFGLTNLSWSLRKTELTLSGIPGGILFPDGPLGTVTIPDGAIHIGGATDVHVRGSGFDEAVLVIDNLTDDNPETAGLLFDFDDSDASQGELLDLVLGTTYLSGDDTFQLLARAGRDSLTLQILDGVNAGVFRILGVDQAGPSPIVKVTPVFPSAVATPARWRIFDDIDVALYDVKETRVSGNDLATIQNFAVVTTSGAVDFDAVGVSKGDVLRVLTGPDAGDYALVEDPLAPGFTSLRVDTVFKSSQSALAYVIFRPNASGNLSLPLIRIESVELLDSSKQPLGTTIPYARPVDVQSRAFQNPARGVKHDVDDAVLGLVSQAAVSFAVGGGTLHLQTPLGAVTVGFSSGPTLTLAQVITELNAAILAQVGEPEAVIPVGLNRFGIRPFGLGGVVVTMGDNPIVQALFGGTTFQQHTTSDIRSDTIDAPPLSWGTVQPFIDFATGLDVVQLIDGNQIGFVPGPFISFPAPAVAPATDPSTALLPVDPTRVFFPEAGVRLQVGTRSIGSARVFFLDPTSFEVRSGETFFEVTTDTGLLRFTPDPTLDAQRIPALPNGDKPKDGVSNDTIGLFDSASQDFLLSSIQAGDKLIVDYHPISGAQVLADPVNGLVNLTLIFSIDGSPDKTLVFIRDNLTLAPTEVSRAGVVKQINAAAGIDIAQLTGANHLEFEADASIIIRGVGTANSLLLGVLDGTGATFIGFDQNNRAPHAGEYAITDVPSQTELTISPAPSSPGPFITGPYTRQQFKVFREGVQRISTSLMKSNTADAGLYFFDVELVSEGVGDLFNIDSGLQLTASGFHADGYSLTTEDSNLTFSTIERPRMSLSKSILEDGVDDDPANATQLAGQNIQLTYSRSSLVEDAQNFISSETERVVNESPLGRHLIPHFVRFDLTYVGGSKEEVVIPDVEDYITKLAPAEALESSDLQKIVSDRGATSIDNPLDLIALVHNVDRSITAARSQNRLTTGRLAAFIPDLLNIKRNIT